MLSNPPADAHKISFGASDLRSLRDAVGAWAAEELLAPPRGEELVAAINELAANSVRYGGGAGTLRMWREEAALFCEVRDCGRLADPLAGRLHPGLESRSGRGLWIVNSLCDLVQVHTSRAGTAIRVRKRLGT